MAFITLNDVEIHLEDIEVSESEVLDYVANNIDVEQVLSHLTPSEEQLREYAENEDFEISQPLTAESVCAWLGDTTIDQAQILQVLQAAVSTLSRWQSIHRAARESMRETIREQNRELAKLRGESLTG